MLLAGLISASPSAVANQTITVPVASEAEISVEQFPSNGKYLMLWIAPEYGLRAAHRSLAKMLNAQNIEVWMSNVVESLFMTQSSSSIKKLDGNYVADLIEYAHKTTGKKIILAGDSYAAISVLRGAHQWQSRTQTQPYLVGAMLFTPLTYTEIPPLGQLPRYMPIVSATNIPLMIYQAKHHGGSIGQFNTLVGKLRQHGNPVFTRITPKEMALFYEENMTPEILQLLKPLPLNIKKMITLLDKQPHPLQAIPLKKNQSFARGIDNHLKKYIGQVSPLAINLEDTSGRRFKLDDYKGKVTVINFWATWCPPCVHEIPSLNKLKEKMQGLPFKLISINYAEDKETINQFMQKVHVEYPVLLDTDGDFARNWNVITYPSTFVIDKNGKIVYGVNGAIEWDDEVYIKMLKNLL